MYIALIIIVFIAVAAYVLMNQNTGGEPELVSETGPAEPTALNRAFAYLSRGKLFLKSPDTDAREVHSEYVQNLIDKREKSKRLHGWKKDTGFNTSYAGGGMRQRGEMSDSLAVEFTSLAFVPGENKLLYFIRDEAFGGLFEYDIESEKELRLVHRQNLEYEDLHINPDRDRLLCTSRHDNGIANLVSMTRDGSEYRELTAGDSADSSPCWVGENQVVYQSQGIARATGGFLMAYGPASIQLLDLESSEIEPVLEDPAYDFLQPRVDSTGHLYYLRRPYEAPRYGGKNILVDILMFPFRLLRAIFHYLNFFSMMYSRKPLTGAGGPDMQVDVKELMLKGMRIDAERALKRERPVNGVPSLVPSSWQLVRRTKQGQETVLAGHVAAFSISADDSIVYTNGYGIFELTPNGSATIARDRVVEEIVLT
ncbi:MAG: hypothetical protein QNI99_12950 [Woeseiaceae bacterium]|nr:hypothetical protein [Woeseiaceae bacterium]